MQNLSSIVASVLALGMVILIHEFGHFLVARASGMTVHRFSIGFGPGLLRFPWLGTTFQIAPIPLGGYVQIDGLGHEEGEDPRRSGSYASKPMGHRVALVLGGPLANYLLGFVVFLGVYAVAYGEAGPPFEVVEVVRDSPAEKAGLRAGDVIVGTSSAAFSAAGDFGAAMQEIARKGPVALVVRREGALLSISVSPALENGRYMLGIRYDATRIPKTLGATEVVRRAFDDVVEASAGVLSMFRVSRWKHMRLEGPIGMVGGLSRQARRTIPGAIQMVGSISVMVGIFNLLPIPGLDGSRLLFLVVGLVRKKEIDRRVESIVHAVGILVLIALFVVVSIGDIFG